MAGRRTSLAALAGDEVESVPGESQLTLLHVPLDKLVATRFNPRRNFGTEDQIREFGQVLAKRQLQPAVVVSRAAYLKLWPEEAEAVGDVTYVIANGERRFRGAKAAGLERLWIVHREEVAKSKADFLDAVLSENNDREDLDPIERALGMETMVTELGGAGKVAAHYGKSAGWVSQQRKLLKLVPELQTLVSSGEMPQREGYRIAGLPAEAQAAEWQAELARREAAREAAEAAREAAKQDGEKAPSGQATEPTAEPGTSRPGSAGQPSEFSALNAGGGSGGSGPSRGASGPAEQTAEFSALNGEGKQAEVSGAEAEAASQQSTSTVGTDRSGETEGDPATGSTGHTAGSDDPLHGLDPNVLGWLPWKDVAKVADVILACMPTEDVKRLNKHLWARCGE